MTAPAPALVKGWVTSDQAAEIAGITPASFRREVTRQPSLQAARAMLGPLACYREAAVYEWLAARPGKGRHGPR